MIETRQQAKELLVHYQYIPQAETAVVESDDHATVSFKLLLQGFRYAMSEVQRLEQEAQTSKPRYHGGPSRMLEGVD